MDPFIRGAEHGLSRDGCGLGGVGPASRLSPAWRLVWQSVGVAASFGGSLSGSRAAIEGERTGKRQ